MILDVSEALEGVVFLGPGPLRCLVCTHLLSRVCGAFIQFYQLVVFRFTCRGFRFQWGHLSLGRSIWCNFCVSSLLRPLELSFLAFPLPPQGITSHMSWPGSAVEGGINHLYSAVQENSWSSCFVKDTVIFIFKFCYSSLSTVLFCFMRRFWDIYIVCCHNDFVLAGNLRSFLKNWPDIVNFGSIENKTGPHRIQPFATWGKIQPESGIRFPY